MKSLWALALWTVVLPGCGTTDTYNTSAWVDPRLQPAIDQWVLDCRSTAKDTSKCNTKTIETISVVDGYGEPDTIGRCTVGLHGLNTFKKVTVRKDMLDAPPYSIRALVLHEMLHCRFGFEAHTERGIMAAYSMTEEELRDNWPELLREAYDVVE